MVKTTKRNSPSPPQTQFHNHNTSIKREIHVSKQTGPLVFTATPEMAKQMPKIFRAGITYVANRAVVTDFGSSPQTPKPIKKKKTAPTKKVTDGAKKKKKKTIKRARKVAKSTKRKLIKPDLIIDFIRENEGCNMTAIEGHTHLPQITIRRILNLARNNGEIRTEGQRRGLRYFDGVIPVTSVEPENVAVAS